MKNELLQKIWEPEYYLLSSFFKVFKDPKVRNYEESIEAYIKQKHTFDRDEFDYIKKHFNRAMKDINKFLIEKQYPEIVDSGSSLINNCIYLSFKIAWQEITSIPELILYNLILSYTTSQLW